MYRSDTSPSVSLDTIARTAGVSYLLIIVGGLFAEFFVRQRLLVDGDAAATAANLVASPLLFRFGMAVDLVVFSCDVVVAVMLYLLLRSVSPSLALLATAFRLVEAAILGMNMLNHLTALVFSSGGGLESAFTEAQLQALTMMALDAHAVGYSIGLVFFGFGTVLLGRLFGRTRLVPRWVSGLLAAAGAVYVFGSFVHVLVPTLEKAIMPIYAIPLVSELAVALWLTVRGAGGKGGASGPGFGSSAPLLGDAEHLR